MQSHWKYQSIPKSFSAFSAESTVRQSTKENPLAWWNHLITNKPRDGKIVQQNG